MAEDNAAFLRTLDLAPAHLVGWSDGAAVGLLRAWRYPELVRKLVYIGQNMTPRRDATAVSGNERRVVCRTVAADDGADVRGGITRRAGALSGGLWPAEVVLDKRPGVANGTAREVSIPTLVMMGDHDIPSVEHADDIRNRLADAQLAIVPGTSHALPMEKPDLVNRLILDFLADSQTAKMFN
jgi:pimeloyl-ACP methyl ester carboxylesterase